MIALIAAILVCLFGSAFFSGTETGAYCVNRVRLQLAAGRGNRTAGMLNHLLEEPQSLLIASLTGTNICDFLATALMAMLFVKFIGQPPGQAELLTTAVMTPIIFVFGTVIPKTLYRREANRLMGYSALPLGVFTALLKSVGLVALLRKLTDLMLRLLGGTFSPQKPFQARQRIALLLKEGVAEGVMTVEQSRMVDRVMKLSSVIVGHVMIPRRAVAAVAKTMNRKELIDVLRKHPFSRFPVCGDHPAKIVGILNARELILRQGTDADGLDRFCLPPVELTPQQSVHSALVRLHRLRQAMGVVIDRRGYMIGIVTVKDLAEEVVGELKVW